jgi:hypothetical protein
VHPSAEHIFLSYFFRTAFLGATSSFADDDSRFLFEAHVFFTLFTDDLLGAAADLRVEDARRRVEEASADEFVVFFFLEVSFAAAAASDFLSWLSL